MLRRAVAILSVLIVAASGFGALGQSSSLCREVVSSGDSYAVCRFDPGFDRIRLFHAADDGESYAHFNRLKAALEKRGEALLFAMNAGMYHEDRRPVGLYIEEGVQTQSLNTNPGPGNFHMLPNGVFYVDDNGAGVLSTEAYAERNLSPAFATQSGPMLVIDGDIHPKFLPDSTSRKRRNGVGFTADGAVVFAISDGFVTFHEFAALFRDVLKCPNALYLDGTISRLYAPELGRNDPGAAMGPIVAVTVSTGQ